jgi:hypothetical protein
MNFHSAMFRHGGRLVDGCREIRIRNRHPLVVSDCSTHIREIEEITGDDFSSHVAQ